MKLISNISLMKFYIFFGLLSMMLCCKPDNKSDSSSRTDQPKVMLFDILSPEQTGINFENKITETLSMNGLFYEYYYNGAGLSVADFNNDGLQDVYFVSNLHPNKLYLNMGNLKFKDISQESGTAEHFGFSTGVTEVDINYDGWMDIYISNSGRFDSEMMKNKLFVNQGINKNGIPVFKEESSKYNLDIPLCSTQAAFFDYDRDNDLDMFLINHYPDIYNVSEIEKLLKTESNITGDRLYQNQDGKYIDVSKKTGLINNSLSYGLGLGISDLNNDGWCDIITLDMMAEENYGIKASYGSMSMEMFRKLKDLDQNNQYMFNALQMNNGVLNQDQIPLFSDIAQLAGIPSTDWS